MMLLVIYKIKQQPPVLLAAFLALAEHGHVSHFVTSRPRATVLFRASTGRRRPMERGIHPDKAIHNPE